MTTGPEPRWHELEAEAALARLDSRREGLAAEEARRRLERVGPNALPQAQTVRLAVYNALGQRVRLLVEGMVSEGAHEVQFEARDLPSGTYFYRLESQAGVVTRSMILMK